jgi:hypothetical protein
MSPSGHTLLRWDHTRRRRRLLYSQFIEDLREKLARDIGHVRKEAWGDIDLSGNPFLALYEQLAVAYTERPIVRPPPGGDKLAEAIAESGYWELMQRIQRDTLALREMLVHVAVDDEGKPQITTVFPDEVEVECPAGERTRPVVVRRWVKEGDEEYLHEWSAKGEPYYKVFKGDVDVTAIMLGATFTGEAYPYCDADGQPFTPWVIYHAAQTGTVWDSWTMSEIVEGSLNIGVLLTYYRHVVLNAAWAQRWVMGAQPAGAELIEGQGDGRPGLGSTATRHAIVADPSTLLQLSKIDPDDPAAPQIGQWSPPADPEAILRSVLAYEARILDLARARAGASRTEADIRSGYSLAVERESVRELQKSFIGQFALADAALVAIVANLRGLGEPTMGWRFTHYSPPKSAAELRTEREELQAKQSAGLLSKVGLYMALNPGASRDEAILALAEAAADEADLAQAIATRLGGVVATPVAPVSVGAGQNALNALVQATAGALPADTAEAALVELYQVNPNGAARMVAPIRLLPPRSPQAGGSPAPAPTPPIVE